MRRIRRGDVRPYPQDGARLVVVLARNGAIPFLRGIMVAPVTTTVRGLPSEVPLGTDFGLEKPAAVNLDAVMTVSRFRLGESVGAPRRGGAEQGLRGAPGGGWLRRGGLRGRMGILRGRRPPALSALAVGILLTLGLSLLATPAAAQTRVHGTCWITQTPEFDPWDPDGDPNTDDGDVQACDPSDPNYDASFFSLNPLRAHTASSSRFEVEGDTDRYGPNTFSLSLSAYCEEAVTVAWKTMGGTATDGVDYHSGGGRDVCVSGGKDLGGLRRHDDGRRTG